ncbi:MAG: hypothetical protein HKM07_04985, partial [Chlamydiae bacterium]|nr:hypothetical protein [Chlamydiota bacterium]
MRFMKAGFLFSLVAFSLLSAQTIDEKQAAFSTNKEGSSQEILQKVNAGLVGLRKQLELCHARAAEIYEKGGQEEEFKKTLEEVKQVKAQILDMESAWRDKAVTEAKKEEEGYALWDQEETTLSQLVLEYGSSDYLYIVPQELSTVKLHLHSSIPIPRESWNDMLEIVLSHNGIGSKKINSYTKQLYILKQDLAAVQNFASSIEELKFVPAQSRVFYVFSPPAEHVKNVFQFFERFIDVKQTFVYQVGNKIAIVSLKEEIDKLLSLYNLVWEGQKGKVSKVVTMSKIGVQEMQRIVHAFFGDIAEKARSPFSKIEPDKLITFPLGSGNTMVLIGQQDVVDRAEKLVKDTEEQLQDPCEMAVFFYSCRHSDPTDLAKVLEKVYTSLVNMTPDNGKENYDVSFSAQGFQGKMPEGYPPQVPPLTIAPTPLNSGVTSHLEVEKGYDHFIPDPKTGTLLMVIRRDAFLKIKELLRKLDIPKKMVQIEVLLFEKKLRNQNDMGMNLLKIGSHKNQVQFDGLFAPSGKGVLQFLLRHSKTKHFPAFDLTYSFLMTQEDIQLHASPSVTTVNQTPATIAIQEEISINNGAAPVNASSGTIVFENSYTRANYGILIKCTPTIHSPADWDEVDENSGFVTLQTDITFDTTHGAKEKNDRPQIERRHIENEVRVAN